MQNMPKEELRPFLFERDVFLLTWNISCRSWIPCSSVVCCFRPSWPIFRAWCARCVDGLTNIFWALTLNWVSLIREGRKWHGEKVYERCMWHFLCFALSANIFSKQERPCFCGSDLVLLRILPFSIEITYLAWLEGYTYAIACVMYALVLAMRKSRHRNQVWSILEPCRVALV